jgi:hypothetical protein
LLQRGVELGGVPLAAGVAAGAGEYSGGAIAQGLDSAPFIGALAQLDEQAIGGGEREFRRMNHESAGSSSGAAALLRKASTSARVGIEGCAPGRVTQRAAAMPASQAA